jgi:hypothetical protein
MSTSVKAPCLCLPMAYYKKTVLFAYSDLKKVAPRSDDFLDLAFSFSSHFTAYDTMRLVYHPNWVSDQYSWYHNGVKIDAKRAQELIGAK